MNDFGVGQIYTTNTFPGTNSENSNESIQARFLEFLRLFRIGSNFVYRDQIRQNILVKSYFIEIDFAHLISYDEYLSNDLKVKPKVMIPLFENATRKLAAQTALFGDQEPPKFQVMLISRSNPVSLRDLDTNYLNQLVRVSGIILSANSMQSKATVLHLTCRSCRHVMILEVPTGIQGVTIPRNCTNEREEGTDAEKCPLDPYIILHQKSTFIDLQMLKIQEHHHMVPVGELPRSSVMYTERYLTGKVVPGMRVTITGVLDIFGQSAANKKKDLGGISIRQPYLQVYGLQLDPDANGASARTFSPLEEEEFLAISRRPNIYNEFVSSLAPSIYGSEDLKKSIACLLFSGTKKYLPDGMRLRGDINVLFLGDPGTAKSQLLKFTEQVAPISVYTSGKGSSAAGLTASVNRDPATREFRLEAGAMVLADGGVVCIDEFDKMRDEDRVAIHEAMEQQTISIAKAGITTILNSRTSVLAAANPVFGRYDDMKSPGENIDFQTTILSRFDLIFVVRDEHNEARDITIAKHVLGVHRRENQPTAEGDLDIQKMRSYISYCKSKCAPRLSSEASKKLSSYFVEMRARVRSMNSNVTSNAKTAIPITVRQLEAIIRITESLAKMSLSPLATERHVDEAIRLFNVSTMTAIQSGLMEAGPNGKFVEEMQRVESYILKRFVIGSEMSENNMREELLRKEFSAASVDRVLHKLKLKQVLFQERRGRIKRIA